MFSTNTITIYTDGSSRGNPGRGGFASIVVFGNESQLELGGKFDHTTNNKMEIMGVLHGLKTVFENKEKVSLKKIHVNSDSKYVLQGITSWIHGWKKNNWRTAAKAPVLNQELWQELDEVRNNLVKQGFDIQWSYVKGHSDNVWNTRADEIATRCADDEGMIDGEIKVLYEGEVSGL
jgi:ribonuclease HI